MRQAAQWRARYLLRRKRQLLLLRAFRRRRELTSVADRTAAIRPGDILLFACMRNEAARLPFFLTHYRRLGVRHFLIVSNDSTDDSVTLLRGAADASLWTTSHSYRGSRFGMDWVNGLLARYGHGHWCLTVDADELLLLPHHQTRGLPGLTAWLDGRGAPAMVALMLDLYPRGPLSQAQCAPDRDPTEMLGWFDPAGYDWQRQPRFQSISIRGGPRQRVFFGDAPQQAPHLHKIPLIRWHWRYAYLSSTHLALPPRLNQGFDARLNLPSGVLLHTKFLDQAIDKAREDRHRRAHFTHAEDYGRYYARLIADPVLWTPESAALQGWEQLETLGLMTRGDWR